MLFGSIRILPAAVHAVRRAASQSLLVRSRAGRARSRSSSQRARRMRGATSRRLSAIQGGGNVREGLEWDYVRSG